MKGPSEPGARPVRPEFRSISLTDPQRDALEAIYDPFHATGQWPTFLYLTRKLGPGGDLLWDTLRSLPTDGLLIPGDIAGSPWPNQPYPDNQELSLTLRGLTCLDSATPDLEMFIRVLPLVVSVLDEMAPEDPNPARITAETVMRALGIGDPAIRRLWFLLANDPFIHGGSSSGAENWADWQLTIRQTASRYRDAESITDYFSVRDSWAEREISRPTRSSIVRPDESPIIRSSSKPARQLWQTVDAALRHPVLAAVVASILVLIIVGLYRLAR